MTLKYDGTTKRGGHVVEVELANKQGNMYLLSIQNQTGGTAAEYAKTIKDSMSVVGVDVEQVKNTMTDRLLGADHLIPGGGAMVFYEKKDCSANFGK